MPEFPAGTPELGDDLSNKLLVEDLALQVKAKKRSSKVIAARWHEFVHTHGFLSFDPLRHKSSFLTKFLDSLLHSSLDRVPFAQNIKLKVHVFPPRGLASLREEFVDAYFLR